MPVIKLAIVYSEETVRSERHWKEASPTYKTTYFTERSRVKSLVIYIKRNVLCVCLKFFCMDEYGDLNEQKWNTGYWTVTQTHVDINIRIINFYENGRGYELRMWFMCRLLVIIIGCLCPLYMYVQYFLMSFVNTLVCVCAATDSQKKFHLNFFFNILYWWLRTYAHIHIYIQKT